MRHILPTALIIALTSPCVSDAQVKKSGGFFGFNRNEEQISSGLFPNEITTQPAAQTSVEPSTSAPAPPPETSSHEGIFRGGSPSPVAPVSYTIEDGQKVKKGSNKSGRKSSFFGFGKKDAPEESDSPIVTPVPAQSPYVSPTADPVVTVPVVTVPAAIPATVAAPAVEWSAPAPLIAENKKEEVVANVPADTPTFKTEEKAAKSGGFFSFFSRKKSEPVAAIPTVSPPVAAVATATDSVVETANSAENIFEVPSMPNSISEPKKEKKSIAGTLLSPVSKIRPLKKELDFTGAETIISDGEIVNDDGQSLASRIVTTQGDGKKDPPKIINGVKTYTSWDDVEGSTVSAADKIIRQIR